MHPGNVTSLFVGTWSLLNVSSTQNGIPNTDPGFGPHPTGLILYHPNGYMSAALHLTTPADRPANLTWPYNHSGSDDRAWARVGEHSIAYMGPYRLNEAVPLIKSENKIQGQIVHGPLEATSLPSFEGTYQARDFEFVLPHGKEGRGKRGGVGTLLNLKADLGRGTRMDLWWEKSR